MDKDTAMKLRICLQLLSDVGQTTYLLCFCFLITFCISVYSGRQNWHLPFRIQDSDHIFVEILPPHSGKHAAQELSIITKLTSGSVVAAVLLQEPLRQVQRTSYKTDKLW